MPLKPDAQIRASAAAIELGRMINEKNLSREEAFYMLGEALVTELVVSTLYLDEEKSLHLMQNIMEAITAHINLNYKTLKASTIESLAKGETKH